MSSSVPCRMRNGAASFVTCVTGEAAMASAFFSSTVPPSRDASAPCEPTARLLKKLGKSLGPQKSTTQATLLDWPGEPPVPSSSFTPLEVPSMLTRCPPADAPQTPTQWGPQLYLVAFAFIHRMAAVQSYISPGHYA